MVPFQLFLLSLIFASSVSSSSLSLVPKNYVAVPGGLLMHKDCVHSVESGAVIEKTNEGSGVRIVSRDGSSRAVPTCAHEHLNVSAFYDGWLAYTQWNAKESIDYSSALFNVPKDLPMREPARLYIFNALQNDDWVPKIDPQPAQFDIIQPVLQTPRDGGRGWSVKSWYVTLKIGALASPELELDEGDELFGYMQRTDASSYFVNSVSKTTGKNTSLSFSNMDRLKSQPWAFNVIECYGCNSCAYQPTDPIIFKQIRLEHGTKGMLTPQWQSLTSPNPVCKTNKAIVNSASEVTLSFQ